MRHATSNFPKGVPSDFERPLTPHGQTEALEMAQRLKASKISIDELKASAAFRTTHTAKIIAETLNIAQLYFFEELYNAPYEVLLQAIVQTKDSSDSLMILAHNPGVSMLISYFLGNYGDVPPATVIEIHFDTNTWSEIARDKITFDTVRSTLD